MRMKQLPDDWSTPMVTQNATMLTGMFAGSVPFGYRLFDLRPGLIIIENEETGNRYS